METLFSTSQVAEIIGVTRTTIFRWIKDGILKAQKVGNTYLVSREELVRHIGTHPLTETDKRTIRSILDKTIKDYGVTIRMLSSE